MKTAMIWGADGGIGQAVLSRLADEGWTTIAIGRRPHEVLPCSTHALAADVSNTFSVQTAVHAAAMEVDEVDLWIYCIGDIASARTADMDETTWKRIMDANLTGAYQSLHSSLYLLASDAHIFFVGAVNERLRLPGLSAYAAAKAGLEAFVEALGKEERKKKVSILRPGAVRTDFWDKVPFRMPASAVPPEQVAQAILQAYDRGHTGKLDI